MKIKNWTCEAEKREKKDGEMQKKKINKEGKGGKK